MENTQRYSHFSELWRYASLGEGVERMPLVFWIIILGIKASNFKYWTIEIRGECPEILIFLCFIYILQRSASRGKSAKRAGKRLLPVDSTQKLVLDRVQKHNI